VYRGGGMPLTLTRLHVRYDAQHFPEDLMFQETGDEQSFQARYVIRHPFRGELVCAQAKAYRDELRVRHEREAETLASLTGWDQAHIHSGMGRDAPERVSEPWWKKLWRR
jgi:hypothetical protein